MKKRLIGVLTRKRGETALEFTKRTMDTHNEFSLMFNLIGEIILLQEKDKSTFLLKEV